MKIDRKIFYAIILALLLNECKIAGCVTNRVDPDKTPRFCPSVPSQFAPLPHPQNQPPEKFSVFLAHPVFKYPLHENFLIVGHCMACVTYWPSFSDLGFLCNGSSLGSHCQDIICKVRDCSFCSVCIRTGRPEQTV